MISSTGRIRTERSRIILEAAMKEFAHYGYAGATVQGIADRAELPKPNIIYYFNNKQAVYDKVLLNILKLFQERLSPITAEDDPAQVLKTYIHSKVSLARDYPAACRIFASEIVHGGQNLSPNMKQAMRKWANRSTTVFQQWVDEGKMTPVDPTHLLFMIWGSSQFYADYETQVKTVINRKKISRAHYQQAAETICDIVLRGCGLNSG
ncbi:TetR family transcriptional regulator [Endozoicomonas sp. OPT23]|uniref:TetR/AcrR family transcriptional regulator n=1 Tax=Endozoicomonas sp. OPT23 TaxID=2072845 RepID=UPI00129AE914|nr:TetR/AcrR family transcriptional regulator [Endozoicomonas sp. OPT23]MRI33227.1 TetR family transcriptional regulator [Endozoicomonas sp. OPT23]